MMRSNLIEWVYHSELDHFMTVTLRSALLTPEGFWRPITPEDVKRTAWLLRDRFTKALVGPAAFKRKEYPPFIAFAEGDGRDKRFHLHAVASNPLNISEFEYAELFRRTARKLDWVHSEIDVRPIEKPFNINTRSVISYCLKDGTNSFLPEASFIPDIS